MMKSILIGISKSANLETDGKWKLWKKTTSKKAVNGIEYFIADAVELSFFFGKIPNSHILVLNQQFTSILFLMKLFQKILSYNLRRNSTDYIMHNMIRHWKIGIV